MISARCGSVQPELTEFGCFGPPDSVSSSDCQRHMEKYDANIDISVVTVSYNSSAVLPHLLDVFRDSGLAVTVVDNASTDGTRELVRSNYPEVELIENSTNLGYGRAANVALKGAETPFVLLLNPDVTLHLEQVIKLLRRAKDHPCASIISAATTLEKYDENVEVESVEVVLGAVMLLNMNRLKEVGFFDEKFFLFFEETDLCRRSIDHGLEVLLCRDILMPHVKGRSTPSSEKIQFVRNWHYAWSQCYFNRKYGYERALTVRMQVYKIRMKALLARLLGNRPLYKKYLAKAAGRYAFMCGIEAFDDYDRPQMFD